MDESTDAPILVVDDLRVHFPGHGDGSVVKAVDGVDLALQRRETLAIVGESGSGKSTIARTIMGLIAPTSGSIRFEDEPLASLSSKRSKAQRRGLQMVFQNSRSSLNPRMRIGQSIAEPLRIHGVARKESDRRVAELVDMVGLSQRQAQRLPHELSGGQQQRVGIARALALNPKVVVLDEPVSALDVSVQAQVLNLLSDLQQTLGLAYIFISHDLAVVQSLSDRALVLFHGRAVEEGTACQIVERPVHPYTKALVSAVPISDPRQRGTRGRIEPAATAAVPDDEAHTPAEPAAATHKAGAPR
jgi:ABC-type glutathione transport system ATPase component